MANAKMLAHYEHKPVDSRCDQSIAFVVQRWMLNHFSKQLLRGIKSICMQNKTFTILFSFLFCASLGQGQDLPDEMRISEDGRRLILGGNASEGFYDESTIRTIDFHFDQSNYWDILSSNYDTGTDLMATIAIDGETIDSVGIRFKGATSYFRNTTQKKSFNVSLDFLIDDRDFMGYETFNLNGNYDDPSSIREILYNHVGRNYTPGLKSNFVQLKINGENWGPYVHVQQLNGEYLKEWFLSNDGTRWRAMREGATGGGPGGGGPGGGGGGGGGANFGRGVSSLNYLGEDTTAYIPNYTLKRTEKDHPWEDLVRSTDKLNNLSTDGDLYNNLKDYLDIDKALWFLAHEIIFADEDSYVWKGGMDYYVYWEAETGRLVPLEYDGNSCMVLNATNWSPFYRENETDFPLMNKLFANPELRQRYLAHFRTILADYFSSEHLNPLIEQYKNQISSLLQNDDKKIYSFTEFEEEVAALKTFVAQRSNYLLSNAEIAVEGLTIEEVNASMDIPIENATVEIQTKVSGNVGVDQVRLYYGTGLVGTFERVEMTDLSNGMFSANIPGYPAGTYVRYYVEAIANNTAKTATFMPKGAEHDVYFFRVSSANSNTESEVVINEFLASNDAVVADQDGEFDDWIELYNTSETAIDLSGYFLSDNPENLDKYEIPSGTIIPANDYLIIWADEDGSQEGLHANFKLSASGEEIFFLDPEVNVLDEIVFGSQTTDISYARMPNGYGDFTAASPTFKANNEGTTATDDVIKGNASLFIYPNPASAEVIIAFEEIAQPIKTLKLFDVYGRLLESHESNVSKVRLRTEHLANGVYFVMINDTLTRSLIIEK